MIVDYLQNSSLLNEKIQHHSSVYCSKSFSNYINSLPSHQFKIYYSERFDAIMPLVIVKNKFLTIARYADIPTGNRKLSESELVEFCNEFIGFCKKTNLADRITFYLPFKTFSAVPQTVTYCHTGHYEINIKDFQADTLFEQAFKSKTKNMIRTAQKSNITIKKGNDLFDDFYKLYADTGRRSASYIDDSRTLQKFLDSIAPASQIYVAYNGIEPQSAALIAHGGKEAFYLYAGSSAPIIAGSTNLLQYHIMLDLLQLGCETYYLGGARIKNIEGTKYAGIQKFKESLCGTIVNGYLWKTDISKIRCRLYDCLLNAKIRIKGGVPSKDYIDYQL